MTKVIEPRKSIVYALAIFIAASLSFFGNPNLAWGGEPPRPDDKKGGQEEGLYLTVNHVAPPKTLRLSIGTQLLVVEGGLAVVQPNGVLFIPQNGGDDGNFKFTDLKSSEVSTVTIDTDSEGAFDLRSKETGALKIQAPVRERLQEGLRER